MQFPNLEITERLFLYFGIVALIIFALVVYFVKRFTVKYRDKGEIPVQSGGNEKFELVMIVIAVCITAFFLVMTLTGMKSIQTIPDNPKADLNIIGHQWWWEARYTDSGVLTANEIHIPVGKKILLGLTSEDVIHSWWIPDLGRKLDMIPGMKSYMWLYSEKEGEFLGACSEFCGAQHARMRIRVIVQNQEDFKAWEQEQLKDAKLSSDPLFNRGKQVFEERTCTNCHSTSITKGQENPNIGPNLTHFASREHFLSDMKENNKENLRAWLKDPQQVKSGAKMPNFIFSEEELEALVHYLSNLK